MKSFKLLILSFMLIMCMFAMVSCDTETKTHEHTIVIDKAIAATCTQPGLTEGSHCSVCNEVITEQKKLAGLGHAYDSDLTVDQEPTCTKNGIQSRHCSRCDFKAEITEISALGHSWNDGTVTTQPTCTEKGIKTFTCASCTETRAEDIDAIGHSFDDGTITTPPTCTELGVKTFTCAICTEIRTEDIDAIGHSFDDGTITTPPTCIELGVKTFTCMSCTSTRAEDIDKLEHNYIETYVEETADKSAYIHSICSLCQDEFSTDIQPITITINETGYTSFNSYKKSVSVSVSATGGYGDLQYKFETFSSSSSTSPLDNLTVDFSSQTSYGIQSAITVNGMVIQVTVKDNYGNIQITRHEIQPTY